MKKYLLVLGLSLFSFFAHASGVVRNGGDERALQFTQVANKMVVFLDGYVGIGFDMISMKQALRTTKVESVDHALILDGTVKDAINYPGEKRIVFNRQSWDRMSEESQVALVLHEYLGIMGVEDTGYKISKQVLRRLNYGRVTGVRTEGINGSQVVRITLEGEAAKLTYFQLNTRPIYETGSAGQRARKTATGVSCVYEQRVEQYSCRLDVGAQGVTLQRP